MRRRAETEPIRQLRLFGAVERTERCAFQRNRIWIDGTLSGAREACWRRRRCRASRRWLASAHGIRCAGRSVLAMNRGWRYHPGKVDGAAAPGFDDSGFSRVVIPHSNVRLPWHSFDDKEYEFVSTYRRRFRLPQSARGKRVFVDFEGAMTASTAWINGARLGEYKGGYTPFSFELTPHLHAEGENAFASRSIGRNDRIFLRSETRSTT